jgi:hypothetical protein
MALIGRADTQQEVSVRMARTIGSLGASLELVKDGPELVSATKATTWIKFVSGS